MPSVEIFARRPMISASGGCSEMTREPPPLGRAGKATFGVALTKWISTLHQEVCRLHVKCTRQCCWLRTVGLQHLWVTQRCSKGWSD